MRAGLTAALATLALLAALSLVAWRQGRALEALAELDHVTRARVLVEAERADLQRRIQVLESRSRVVPDARSRLDMRAPDPSEIVILPGDAP